MGNFKDIMTKISAYILIFILLSGFGSTLLADEAAVEDADLFDIPLEQLMEVEITSSARRPQSISRASRAVYVITAEDIRAAGPVRIEDLLRMVPGMDVFQTKNLVSQIGVRGYTKWNNERMQILLDGRPLYDPYLGGSLFYLNPIFTENIERIEVIRGPAGVTWGVNAMNGVINIITKKAEDTQGGLFSGSTGNHSLQQGFIRYGQTQGNFSWRATVGHFNNSGFATENGIPVEDDYKAFQATGLGEWKIDEATTLTFSGGLQNAHSNNELLKYLNLLWRRVFDDGSSLQLRWSESCIDRKNIQNNYSSSYGSWGWYNVADIHSQEEMFELQHNFTLGKHQFVWGMDYTRDIYLSTPLTTTNHGVQANTIPEDYINDQGSAFIEGEFELADNLWYTVGVRGYYNELTNFDWAGRMALVYEFAPKHFLRGSISRSFRRPTMWQEFRTGPNDSGNQMNGEGNNSLINESLLSYEIGYRGQLKDNFSVNVEAYLSKDNNMMALVKGIHETSPWEYWYDKWYNVYDITTYGIESSFEWQVNDAWLMKGFYVYRHQTDQDKLTYWETGETGIILGPKHRIGLTNRFKLDETTTLNTQLYWTDTATPYYEYIEGEPFCRFDVRLAKTFWNDRAEIAVGATNLFDQSHYEGGYDWGTSSYVEVPRQFYIQFFCTF